MRYRTRTSRATTAADTTLGGVRSLWDHKDWESKHENVEALEINPRDWPRTIDAIEEWLCGCLGVTTIPLAYVVRPDNEVPAIDPAGGYDSCLNELIIQAPIRDNAGDFTASYLADRTLVWEKMLELTREHECWSYVRPAQRSQDGRLAYNGLRSHYLGVNNDSNMAAEAERKLATTTNISEQHRWNFEKYVKIHVNQNAYQRD